MREVDAKMIREPFFFELDVTSVKAEQMAKGRHRQAVELLDRPCRIAGSEAGRDDCAGRRDADQIEPVVG